VGAQRQAHSPKSSFENEASIATILAIDLGKYKSVASADGKRPRLPVQFKTNRK
jgi:hypothetical protein